MQTLYKEEKMLTRQGNPSKDQKIIHVPTGSMFVSYGTNIAYVPFNPSAGLVSVMGSWQAVLDEDYWDYSKTTLEYLSRFLDMGGKHDIQRHIDKGNIVTCDLQLVRLK